MIGRYPEEPDGNRSSSAEADVSQSMRLGALVPEVRDLTLLQSWINNMRDTYRPTNGDLTSTITERPQRTLPTDEAPQLRDDPPRCGNCSSATHSLDRCLKAVRGTIPGCPLCKVTGHLLEDCEKFPLANADPSTIMRLVVWDRGNMPAWETKVPWFKYLYFYMGTFEFFLQDRSFVQITPLPWTEAYAREVAALTLLSNTQQNNGDIGSTLSDPQTANLTAA
ncbi:hypothetical protein ACHAPI_011075 [Fusarium lateritium]